MKRACLLIGVVLVLLAQKGDAQSTTTFAWDPSVDVVDGYVGFVTQDPTVPGSPIALGLVLTHQVTRMDPSSVWYFAVASTLNGSRGPSTPFLRVEGTSAPTLTPSPDGTKATSIIDCKPSQWTLGSDGATLRGGVHMGAGYGSVYKLVSCVVWTLGTDAYWYSWGDATNWTRGTQTEPGIIPPPETCAPDGTGNGVDEDQDGQVDEGCLPPPPPPPSEQCGADGYGNGLDDDGDGLIDEGCATPPPPPPPSDTIAPVVSVAVTRSGKSANYTVTATATDNVGVVRIQLFTQTSSTPFYTCSSSPCSATVKLGKGTYTFTAIATDAAGNQGSASQTVSN